MEAKMGALSGYILLLFLWVMVASASQETFLIGEKEEHCFYIHAEENEEFKARVFVFHGGSRDIVFSVSQSSSWQGTLPGRYYRSHISGIRFKCTESSSTDAFEIPDFAPMGNQPTLAPNPNTNTPDDRGVCIKMGQ